MKKSSILIYVLLIAFPMFAQISNDTKAELLDNDFLFTSINFSNYIYSNEPASVKGTFQNKGVKAIERIDITYSVNENDFVETYTLDDIYVETGKYQDFTHNLPINLPVSGDYSLTVVLSNPNGVEALTAKDSVVFSVVENEYIRKVLVEEFSTEKCPNCPPVATYLKNIDDADDNVIMMVHHTGYYSDEYTIDESVALKVFYNAGSFAPAAMMDRHYNGKVNDYSGSPNPGPVFWPGNPYGARRIDDRHTVLSYVDVTIAGAYNLETRVLSVDISGVFKEDITDQLGLSVWVVEDGLSTYNQAGRIGQEWIHHALARKAISAAFGDSIKTSTNTGESYTANYQYTVPADFVDRNLSLIAFVNRINVDVNQRDVLNSNSFKLSDLLQQYKAVFTVTDKNSLPVGNAKITVNGNEILTTDGTGNVDLMLLDGTYTYKIEKYGYEITSGEFTIVDTDIPVNVELTSKVKAMFLITDVENNPISRASVKIVNVPTKVTDNDGKTEFMLSLASYSYAIEMSGYETVSGEFTLESENLSIEVVLPVEVKKYEVTFNVINQNEIPVADAIIYIDSVHSGLTNTSGSVVFSLPSETYNYRVQKVGYNEVSGEFSIVGLSKVINITLTDYVSAISTGAAPVRVYPNPFKDNIVIEGELSQNSTIIIYDMVGKILYSVDNHESTTVISTTNFKEGIYFINIINDNTQSVFKVIK